MPDRPWSWRYSQTGNEPPLRLLLVQPTPFCNINCRYCYLPHRSDGDKISLGTFDRLLDRINESSLASTDLTILWHGGEPLTIPTAFYREAYRLARVKFGTNFRFNFQTNATLISPEFCDFVAETNARVGVSIDGPSFLTDAHRVHRSGRGMFPEIMRGISSLKARCISFGAICVLTRDSLEYPDELYEFFVGLGADNVGFNIEEIEGVNSASSLSSAPATIASYMAFVTRIAERISKERPATRFREFSQLRSSLCFGTEVFSRLVNPFSIISVDWRGNYSTFSPELLYNPEHVIGNVYSDSIEAAARSPAFQSLSKDIARGVQRCRANCDYFGVCGGGSPSNKIAENGTADSEATIHCLYTKRLLADVMLTDLERLYGLASEPAS